MELAVGPMSPEIVEAVFRYSQLNKEPLMLIASKNQVDYDGGYVNNWTTKGYMQFVKKMRGQYPRAYIKVCRDHCGPGFNGNYNLDDTYATINEDIKRSFDLMHIDFCHYRGPKKEQLEETKKAILYCLNLNPLIEIEIGTDENTGANYSERKLAEIERDIDFFKNLCSPTFYVVQTGSLVKEINQVGTFNAPFIKKVATLFKKKELKLKEHNADYLAKKDIQLRKGIVDAQNIAPQLGVIQTQIVITKCLMYGIPMGTFLQEVYEGGKWKKWMHNNTGENKKLCAIIAGHYHFSGPSYRSIMQELTKRENIKETIINSISDVIGHYVER